MNSIFLDTSHVVAFANKRDAHHKKALALAERVSREGAQVVTTQAVLTEIGNALSSIKSRSFAVRYIASVEQASTFEVVYSTADLFHRGLELYRERQDKTWGLTDCISFTVMREHSVIDALTADRHFEQAGFTALLRE